MQKARNENSKNYRFYRVSSSYFTIAVSLVEYLTLLDQNSNLLFNISNTMNMKIWSKDPNYKYADVSSDRKQILCIYIFSIESHPN